MSARDVGSAGVAWTRRQITSLLRAPAPRRIARCAAAALSRELRAARHQAEATHVALEGSDARVTALVGALHRLAAHAQRAAQKDAFDASSHRRPAALATGSLFDEAR